MDRLTIETPERVALEIELAGLGSRFAALVVDGLMQAAIGALVLGLLAVVGALSCDPALTAVERQIRGEPDALAALSSGRFLVTVTGALFGVQVAYHALFEALQDGQTPGKRLLGIRVVRDGGRPLGVGAAVLRNLLRPFDFLPIFFGVGGVLALVTRRSQRLGDLVARTLVVRERSREVGAPLLLAVPGGAPAAARALAAGAPLSVDERALVAEFLDRRALLDPAARARLATRLADGLRRRHGDRGGPPATAEGYLERLGAERVA